MKVLTSMLPSLKTGGAGHASRRKEKWAIRTQEKAANGGIASLIKERQWATLRAFLATREGLRSVFYFPSNEADASEGSLLILACRNQAPLDVVKLLISARPESVREQHEELRTPLHVASMCHAPLDVISLLVSRYPEAVSTVDSMGKTPLILLLDVGLDHGQNLDSTNVLPVNHMISAIKLLHSISPETVHVEDENEESALEHAIQNHAHANVIDLLQRLCTNVSERSLEKMRNEFLKETEQGWPTEQLL